MDWEPLPGPPQVAGWYWVYPKETYAPVAAKIEWIYNGPATLIPELHCTGYTPATGDVWFGPMELPPVPPWYSVESAPETQQS